SRTVTMVEKYFDGVVPEALDKDDVDDELISIANNLPKVVESYMDKLQFSNALAEIWKLVGRANKYIDETMPWMLAKDESKKGRLKTVLYNLVESLRFVAILITPFMPNTPIKIYEQLGISDDLKTWDSLKFGLLKPGTKVKRGENIFPRIDVEKEIKEAEKESPKKVEVKEETNYIKIDDFAKIDLRVAEVLEAEKVEGADKLLKLKLKVGDEVRQVVSGLALHYKVDELIGKKLVLVANLEPKKLRGIESYGMILAASNEGKLTVVTVDKDIESGAKVK
ncbi:methionine--tRNA ligase subunit beta, partial [Thermoanaerobacterium thermosaccharolyticum]|uniref:methionine--tRNA ligase subunit beta n=1 Tax=Thermoanaerobacterium thermosaccharolyticum TaxID=1517 RepID=UPI00123BB8FD